MRAMLLQSLGLLRDRPSPLELSTCPDPEPGPGEVLIRVRACGVCHAGAVADVGTGREPKAVCLVVGRRDCGIGIGIIADSLAV